MFENKHKNLVVSSKPKFQETNAGAAEEKGAGTFKNEQRSNLSVFKVSRTSNETLFMLIFF